MNKEVKFRAWDKLNKAMREIWSITWNFKPDKPEMILACNTVINSQYALYEGQFEIIQYSGLKDKNNKEIYEGDIVKFHDHPTGVDDGIGAVYYKDGAFRITWAMGIMGDFGSAWLEVIGNIYENPELVKQ